MTTHATWPTWREYYEHLIEPLGYRAALIAWLQADQDPADLVNVAWQTEFATWGRQYAAVTSESSDLRVSLAMGRHGNVEVV